MSLSRCHSSLSRQLFIHRFRARLTAGSLSWHTEHSAYRRCDITGMLHIGPYLERTRSICQRAKAFEEQHTVLEKLTSVELH